MRNGIVRLAGACCVVFAAACHGGGSSAGSARLLRIAMIAKSSTNPVFRTARAGAEAAARELSAEHGYDLRIEWLTPPQEDGQLQAQRLMQAVNDGAHAILISCSDAAKITGAINDAVRRGTRVMTFDSDAPESKRFAFYGVDDVASGGKTMAELAALLGGRGVVAILAGNQNAPNLQNRVKGVKEEAAKYPQIEIAGVFYHTETPQDAAAEVVRVNNANPRINAWAMVGGWALFTTTLLKDLSPEKFKIVSIDALPPQLPYIESGIAPVLLAQPTYLWGYESVKIIFNKLVLKKEMPVINKMELVKVEADGLGRWARMLATWGFDDIPPKYLKLP